MSLAAEAGFRSEHVIIRTHQTEMNKEEDLESAVMTRDHASITVVRDVYLMHLVLHKPDERFRV